MFKVVIIIAAPPLTKNQFSKLLSMISQEKQERIKCFHFFRDAQNSLLGDIITRVEICRSTGLSNKWLEFSTNEYGKPFLTNDPHVHYNISHSEHFIACAISNEPVGIDIETIKKIDIKIAEQFFSPDETRYIMGVLHQNRFFEVWTKKESRIKWEGKGLSESLASFSVFDSVELDMFRYNKVFQNDNVICHVCATSKEDPNVQIMNTTTMMRYIKQWLSS